MKKTIFNSLKRILAVPCLLLALFANNASANFLYWNNNGLSTPANGTWDLTTPQWATDFSPTESPVVWDPTAAAVFSVTNTGVGYLGNLTINVDSAIGIAGIYNNGTNGSSPATNLIFTGTGSLDLAEGVNVIAVGNASIGGPSGNNNIFKVPLTGVGSIEFQASVGSEYLAVPNSYSGGTRISTANGINFSTNNVFGTGPITISPSLSQIVWATPMTLPASAGGAPFATNSPISIPNDVVANTAGPFRMILVGNTSAPVTFSGSWDLGSQNTTLDFRTTTVTNSGVISGSGSLTKIGTSGVLVLSGENTYSGKTLINVGTVSVRSINSVTGGSASSSLGAPTTVADGTINLGATTTVGTLIYTGSGETTDRVIDFSGTTGGGTIQNDGTGAIHFTSDFTATGVGVKTFTLTGTNTSTNTMFGNIVENSSANPMNLTKSLAGVWRLLGTNTYSGKTVISRGTLTVNSIKNVGAGASGLGAPTTVANGTINLGGSTTASALNYTGEGDTTDRIINLTSTTGGNAINNNGTGPLVFTSDFTATGNGAKTLTLQGSNTNDNRINGRIVNSTGNTAVTKAGAGTWTLAGANTFSGNISFNAGRLNIANPAALGFGTNVIGGNGSFDNVTGADLTITNALTLSGGSPTYVGSTHNVTYTGPVTISGANRSITVSSNNLTLAGAISADTFTLTKAGPGTLTLTAASDYTNTTILTGGTLALGHDAATGTGSINLNSATGTIRSSSEATRTLANAITISQNTTFGSSTTGDLIFNGDVNAGSVAKTLTINNATTIFNGIISGATTALTKAGSGTLVFNGVNTFTKPMVINAGTLALGSTGSINESPTISIAAGATFDVSAISAFTLSGNTTLSASGTNSAAIIKGGTTVDLGTRPISLIFQPTAFAGDTGHPALVISQGTLSLSGNAFTIDNVSGTALGAGTYQIMQQAAGNIVSSGSHSVTVTGSGLAANATASILVSGSDVNLVVAVAPSGATISNPTILGDGSVQLNFSGTPGVDYVIEAATNLNAPITWFPLSTNTADGAGLFNFIDTDATNFVERFYRTVNE